PLEYCPVERTKSEIRLLKLHGANSWDIIKGSLISVPVSEAPPFEAISYRWASGNEVPILLDRKKFTVAGEVHKLLRTLRYRLEDRLLWLDSICIDQKNNEEKSWQIGFMNEIYSSSEKVIGWI
ncbi:heterokaryon incompatibility protein-domain-containing protein, partial [Tricladium varicosporioides]